MYYDIPMPFPMRYLMPWLIHDFLAKINFFMFYVPFTFFYFFYNIRCNRRGRLIFNNLMKYVAPEKKGMNCLDIVFLYYCIKRIFNRILGILKKGLGLELILSTKKNLENSSILKIINGLKGILSEYFYF